MSNKNDKRILKTRKRIIDAFKSLIAERDYEYITVKDLAARADISRKTFYAHYDTLDDVLTEIGGEILQRVIFLIASTKEKNKNYNFKCFLKQIDEAIKENPSFYMKIITAASYRFFSREIKNLVKAFIVENYLENIVLRGAELDMCCEFFASGLAKLYKFRCDNDGAISDERFLDLSVSLVSNGFLNAIAGKTSI